MGLGFIIRKIGDTLGKALGRLFFTEDSPAGVVTCDRTDITCDQTDITCDAI